MIKKLYIAVIGLMTVLLSAPSGQAYAASSIQQEKAMVKKMGERRKKDRKLSHRVTRLAKKAGRRERNNKAVVPHRGRADVDGMAGLTDNASLAFGKLRGHLPWPVESKKICVHYGIQPYVLNPGVVVNNLGVGIASEKNAVVKSVFDGVVDDVIDIGDGMAIIVRHGKYFSIYSDLGETEVTKGQEVKTGDILGRMGDTGELDFRLYNEHNVWMDPEKWLVR